ncbi:TolB protein [Aestuariispira insulae]|uniref:Tol-Pal system protein TolB n=2 Tax=Aestuariispira insulae TaxID=1461337 RepID=A0A3D9HJX5_9PROT|nr:Tol-Pal system beta propeller repeat protein TolB [Aestuariispira insulae]RED49790.1 TolB protein [Aestuariispira insulae]
MLRLAIFALTALSLAGAARAEVNIDITRGNAEPLPIAITDFFSADVVAADYGEKLAAVISSDLERSGLFRPIDKSAFIQTIASLKVKPRFSEWRVLNAQVLVAGSTTIRDDGQLRVEFFVWDVFSEKSLIRQAFTTQPQNWRRVSHMIADLIYQRLTGETGYFDSRIVYVAESGPKKKRVKRLAIMDQDGANHEFLTDGRTLVLTPRFSPKRHEITYMSYFNDKPRVYIFNIQTGRQQLLGTFPGMTLAPRFSPDGDSVIMSHSEKGNTDIYIMDLRTKTPRQLTKGPDIEISPSFAPDGKRVVYSSDRGRQNQLYVINADGTDDHRISQREGSYNTPVWSPRGDLIAFTKQLGGRFFIGVMRPDGSGERILSDSFLDEGPTWSPNGRVLMFFRQEPGEKGRTRLYSVDLTGHNLREMVTPGDASDPAWSPLNP